MLINPFLILLIVMMTCCTFESSVMNLTYSEQQVFSHTSYFVSERPSLIWLLRWENCVKNFLRSFEKSLVSSHAMNSNQIFLMLINPFSILLIVMMTCCTFESSVMNSTYSEQQVFSILWVKDPHWYDCFVERISLRIS